MNTGAEQTAATGGDVDLPVVTPAANIRDEANAVVLTVDLPGVDEQSLAVSVENGVLTVEGKVRPEVPEGYQRVLAEYGAAHYRRAFHLSDRMNASTIEAKLANGVLRVTVAKREEVKARRIAVTAG